MTGDGRSLRSTVVTSHTSKPAKGTPLVAGPVFASTFHLSGDTETDGLQYGRFDSPNWQALEQALGQLELGKALVFPSGMAAGVAVMTALLKSGDTVLLPNDGYAPMVTYAQTYLAKFGINVKTTATVSLLQQDFSNVDLVLVESPSNPLLDVVDIAQLADKVHQAGGILAIDNTTCTPLGQQPLKLGADISICADTKVLNGHSDVVYGHVATANQHLYESMALWRKLSGSIAGPMETWLVHRGLASLDMRLERMCANALVLANWLNEHPKVASVRFPGLVNDPAHGLAKQQMYNFGYIISFDLVDENVANQFLTQAKMVVEATSFGGLHTMAERRARWGTDDVSPGLVRLSVGCEQVEELLADISQALR